MTRAFPFGLWELGASSANDWLATPALCPAPECPAGTLYASAGGSFAVCPECGAVWGAGRRCGDLERSAIAVLRATIRKRHGVSRGTEQMLAALTEHEATLTGRGRGPARVWRITSRQGEAVEGTDLDALLLEAGARWGWWGWGQRA